MYKDNAKKNERPEINNILLYLKKKLLYSFSRLKSLNQDKQQN